MRAAVSSSPPALVTRVDCSAPSANSAPAAIVEDVMRKIFSLLRRRPVHGRARGLVVLSAAAALLSGCAAPSADGQPGPDAAAGPAPHARILVAEREPARVISAVIRLRVGGEWTLRSADAREVVRSRRLDDLLTAARFGNAFGRRIDQRTVYRIAPTADGVEIIAGSQLVRYPGSAFEHVLHDPTVDATELSRDLRSVKAYLDQAVTGPVAAPAPWPRR